MFVPKCVDAASIFAFSGFILILAGVVLIVIAIMKLLFLTEEGIDEGHGGGAVFVGPFPIIFGTDRKSIEALLIVCAFAYLVITMCMLTFSFQLSKI